MLRIDLVFLKPKSRNRETNSLKIEIEGLNLKSTVNNFKHILAIEYLEMQKKPSLLNLICKERKKTTNL